MAAATAAHQLVAVPNDDVDDMLDFNTNLDDIFRDVDTNMDVPPRGGQHTARPAERRANSVGLGIDEEIKVKKARQPIAKLDEDRLLSQAGIPKLRRTAKERLRFKGKGHEYSDAARLLQFYQLWLDELYPRAKFADGLAIIEKMGHKKRLQTMRREWINEGKPHRKLDEELAEPRVDSTAKDAEMGDTVMPTTATRPATPMRNEDANEDLYSATPQAVLEEKRRKRDAVAGDSLFISDDEGEAGGVPQEDEMDELDALLAEDSLQDLGHSALNAQQPKADIKRQAVEENFDDEMEAMAGMDDMW